MEFRHIVLLILTFVTGVMLGAYVYVQYFKRDFESNELARQTAAIETLSIVVEQSTDTQSVRSYRIISDRSFRYIMSDGVIVTGTMPRDEFRDILDTLEAVDLTEWSMAATESGEIACANVSYDISVTLDGVTYSYTDCGGGTDAFSSQLISYFDTLPVYAE